MAVTAFVLALTAGGNGKYYTVSGRSSIINRAEAIAMCLFEFDEEKYIKGEREWAYEQGQEDTTMKNFSSF